MNHGARRGLEPGSYRFNLMARLLNGHQKCLLTHVFSELCLVALVEACDVALAPTQYQAGLMPCTVKCLGFRMGWQHLR